MVRAIRFFDVLITQRELLFLLLLLLRLVLLLDCFVFLVDLRDLVAKRGWRSGVPHQCIHVAASHGVHVVSDDRRHHVSQLLSLTLAIVHLIRYLVVVYYWMEAPLVILHKVKTVLCILLSNDKLRQIMQVVRLLFRRYRQFVRVNLILHAHLFRFDRILLVQ